MTKLNLIGKYPWAGTIKVDSPMESRKGGKTNKAIKEKKKKRQADEK